MANRKYNASTACKHAGCKSKVIAKGYCAKHWRQWHETGETWDGRKNARKPCSVVGCPRISVARGLCDPHYRAELRPTAAQQREHVERLCIECEAPLDPSRRAGSLYCSDRCKQRRIGRGTSRRHHLKAKYGLTEACLEAMLAEQGGHCAICSAKEPGGRGTWHVDHCHTSGHVRGLLCQACNLMLGHVQDSVDTLLAAVEYLRRHREKAAVEGHAPEGDQAVR